MAEPCKWQLTDGHRGGEQGAGNAVSSNGVGGWRAKARGSN